jgi:hypothetical protein
MTKPEMPRLEKACREKTWLERPSRPVKSRPAVSGLSKRRLLIGGGALVTAAVTGLVPREARAIEPVDLLLSLSADVSRSVDDQKFKLQREGYANAIADPRVIALMKAGPHKRIAINLIEWADVGAAAVMVPWTMIGEESQARDFSQSVLNAARYFRGRTSISTGIDFAVATMNGAPFGAERRVIDISGDGTHNSGRDVVAARNEAVAKGFTINGIAILSAVPLAFNPSHTHPPGGLLKYFEDNVVGGPGAFAISADGFGDFGQAIVQKLIKEIAGVPDPRRRA